MSTRETDVEAQPTGPGAAAPPRAEVSVAVPTYNEVDSLPELHRRLGAVLDGLGVDWELVVSDNRSTDGTRELLRELTRDDPRVRAVLMSRNFGHSAAHLAALEHSSGTWTVLMDADLQDEPEAIPRMLELAERGNDVVYGVRAKRGEGWLMRAATSLFYRISARISEVPQPVQAGPFCLLSRRAVLEIVALPERNVFFPGLRAYLGLRQAGLPLERPARATGRPRLDLRRRVVHALDGLFAFSNTPLRLATAAGLLIACFAALLAVGLAVLRLFTNIFVPGITSAITVILLLGGVQLVTLGVLGEYLGRVYNEVKRRPRFIVQETVNVQLQPEPSRRSESTATRASASE